MQTPLYPSEETTMLDAAYWNGICGDYGTFITADTIRVTMIQNDNPSYYVRDYFKPNSDTSPRNPATQCMEGGQCFVPRQCYRHFQQRKLLIFAAYTFWC